MRPVLVATVLALLVPLAPAAPAVAAPAEGAVAAAPAKKGVPRLKVRPVVRHLDHPWDVRSLPGGGLIFTQRDRAELSVFVGGKVHRVKFPRKQVWVSGETGLMGLEVDPDFRSNRRIYTCQGGNTDGGGHDVNVKAWTLDKRLRKAKLDRELVGGFPTSSGRHGGCRLLVTSDGSLLVGTGDAAQGTNPEDLDSLGGKTLRLDRFTGAPWPGNPFAGAQGPRRYVHTYGHRNVQGVTERADGTLWSIEQGTTRDDEVNLLQNGGDYGYDPVPGYNETVPMTDQGLPGDQIEAKWSSGDPTVATSGGTFVNGTKWRALDGALAVACLKASRVLFLTFDAAGTLQRVRQPRALKQWGRIRTAVQASNGDLLVTTDNGGGNDVILRVRPRG
ncbi:PQQ-dependent sugar dehydrogenase [Nocardioides anomalus]|uniref:PQQ-dependent sugar dehydrogenase n=1 Tax=Nocardioides anomalus TaxID=2712223 RepID=A0A6G6WBZ1_9ACTN|nr:PQQ-dependent sugar dehydrogenase [Nocardioides anomalus]QIG42848.1 PQQ-dependent sugar dehydrogenase [Nocardioides anomalus]